MTKTTITAPAPRTHFAAHEIIAETAAATVIMAATTRALLGGVPARGVAQAAIAKIQELTGCDAFRARAAIRCAMSQHVDKVAELVPEMPNPREVLPAF
jgi:hypothetical protein